MTTSIESEFDRQQEILTTWRGESALVWDLSPTFRRLVVRVGNHFILAVGTRSLSGPLDWTDSRIQLSRLAALPDVCGQSHLLTLRDEPAGFELVCRSVHLVVDPDPFPEMPGLNLELTFE